MKRLFFILTLFLLAGCTHSGFLPTTQKPFSDNAYAQAFLEDCSVYPYDNSDTPCNLIGWQIFVYQARLQTKEAHDAALFALGDLHKDTYKRLFLLSEPYESIGVRRTANKAMFDIAIKNKNKFGQFFYMLASFQAKQLSTKKKVIGLRSKLKKLTQENTKLSAELADKKAKIQAIMEIEKNLNTN